MTAARNELLRPQRALRPMRFAGLERCELAFGEVLHETGARMRHVYFPADSVVSLLATRAQGARPVEVAVVGREGMLGISVAFGVDISPVRAAVQGSGVAMRATPAQFREGLARSPGLRRARWLLMMRERASRDRLELTQHFLGAMLGVRRAGVNEAAGTLQRRKLIRLGRGSMQILDRAGVEATACACYQALKIT